MRIARHGIFEHRHAVAIGADGLPCFVRRLIRGQEQDSFEVKTKPEFFGNEKMPEMDRVERSPQDPDTCCPAQLRTSLTTAALPPSFPFARVPVWYHPMRILLRDAVRMTSRFATEYHWFLMRFTMTPVGIGSRQQVWVRFTDLTRSRVIAGQGDT